MIMMYWSPNIAWGGKPETDPIYWWPGEDYVDIVGVDCYPSSGDTFDTCYGDFYDTFATPYGIPFAIGETGATGSMKESWLSTLVSQNMCDYPLYVAATWFEFIKGSSDWRCVMTDSSDLASTESILLDNSLSGCGTSSPTTTAKATATSTMKTTTAPAATSTCSWG